MGKKLVSTEIQFVDNYVSDFSLQVLKKIDVDAELDYDVKIGFSIIQADIKKGVGQIALEYHIGLIDKEEVARIHLSMEALFETKKKLSQEKFEELLKYEGASTLFHLSRAYIASATALAGMPTIVMPMEDMEGFFKSVEI